MSEFPKQESNSTEDFDEEWALEKEDERNSLAFNNFNPYTRPIDYISDKDETTSSTTNKRKQKSSFIKARENLNNGTWKRAPMRGRSYLSKHFDVLTHNNVDTTFRCCKHCDKIISSSRSLAGSHVRNIHKLSIDSTNTATYLINCKRMMASLCTNFIVEDCRPIDTVDGAGFKKFMRLFGELAAEMSQGNINIDSILPSTSWIKRNVNLISTYAQNTAIKKAVDMMVRNGFCITLDLSNEKVDCLVMTGHFFSDDWTFRNLILSFYHFPLVTTSSGDIIKSTTHNLLKNLGFKNEQILQAAIVTDEGTNVKNAFVNFEKKSICFCDLLNTIAERAVSPCSIFEQKAHAQMISTLKGLRDNLNNLQLFVVFARQNNTLLRNLGTKLFLPTNTRWLSNLKMVKEFLSNIDFIMEICALHASPELQLMVQNLAEKKMEFEHFSTFSDIFSEAVLAFQADKTVTSSIILPHLADVYVKISKFKDADNLIIKSLAASAEFAFHYKMADLNLDIILAAAYLDPFVKAQMPSIQRDIPMFNIERARQAVVKFAEKYNLYFYQPEPLRRKRLFQTSEGPQLEAEFMSYNAVADYNGPATEFWQLNEKLFPILRKVAREILCLQASSAPSENAFSSLSLTAVDLKNRLDPEQVEKLITLRSLIKNNFVDTSAVLNEPEEGLISELY